MKKESLLPVGTDLDEISITLAQGVRSLTIRTAEAEDGFFFTMETNKWRFNNSQEIKKTMDALGAVVDVLENLASTLGGDTK